MLSKLRQLNSNDLQVYALSLLLVVVASLHFTIPGEMLKVMPPFIPVPSAVIFLTGILEIILAFALIYIKTRYFAAITTAIYFALLLPVHIYMIQRGLPIAGISSPSVLWGRALFQFVLIYWAYSLRFVVRSAD